MTEEAPRIALVGHCGPDGYALRSAARSLVPGAEVVMVNDDRALAAELGSADVLLVNRVLDGGFEHASGIELIRELAAAGSAVRPALLLVSNFEDAQAAAEAAGALPGFGKRQIYSDAMRERLAAALAARRAGAQ